MTLNCLDVNLTANKTAVFPISIACYSSVDRQIYW